MKWTIIDRGHNDEYRDVAITVSLSRLLEAYYDGVDM